MSAKPITFKATVYRVTRRPNSVYGNPAYTFHTEQGQFKTSTNANAAYALTNDFQVDASLNNGDGIKVEFTATRAGRITGWELI